jgi:hypothetical protein
MVPAERVETGSKLAAQQPVSWYNLWHTGVQVGLRLEPGPNCVLVEHASAKTAASELCMISMYPKAEILFPPKLIPSLKDLRGPEWAELVSSVARLPETHPDVLAFSLMMIELDGCMNCYAGSYKFMRGCAACAKQTITQYKGSDAELLRLFKQSQKQVAAYIKKQEKKATAEASRPASTR